MKTLLAVILMAFGALGWVGQLNIPVQLQDVAYSGSDALIATLTNESQVHVWSVRSGEAFATINLKDIAKGTPGSGPSNH